ncbi:NAD(P)H-flavin reductase/hemoglobin-like flavoprotein [Catenuloplanes nepalensis]|uniref:NAD(P)H-flavin reductase/hemoglobin-like flavoprotein n=1 Tax=Catenuloplanes nepalensis TaxID=587533 RepID=A0ABT9MLR9_9ACTN|nr:globin domain-containing protein [Catenuloplanes nepalensis]MDP9792228.1 NAD(P)H-flavin reductase/hemoglobin-like flavoprotein [Catenuloplanes nepalensis]
MTSVGGAGHRDLRALLHALRVGKVVEQLPNAHSNVSPPAPATHTPPQPAAQTWVPMGGGAAQQAAQQTAVQQAGTPQSALPRGTVPPRNAAPQGRYPTGGTGTGPLPTGAPGAGALPSGPAVPFPPGPPSAPIPGTAAPALPGAPPGIPGTAPPVIPGTTVPAPYIPGPPTNAPACVFPAPTRTHAGSPPYVPAGGVPAWEAVVPIRGGPNRPAARGALVDGFRPGEESALHALQTRLRESLRLLGDLDEAVRLLDEHLFTARPELRPLFPPSAEVHRQQLRDALGWLVDNLDDPQVLAAGCGQLGPVLREFGVQRAHIDAFGMAMLDAMRAGMAGAWRPEHDAAWRSTWKLAAQWLEQGEEDAGYAPLTWLGTVVARQDWRDDLSILWIRTYLPYPHRAGQRAVLEADGATGAYPIGNPPTPDHTIEVHVEARATDYTGLALLREAEPGERVRLHPAVEHLPVDRASGRDLLLIAEGTGAATMKALLTEVAWRRQHRAVRVFVGVRTVAELYDLEPLRAIAAECLDAQVQVVVTAGPQGRFLGGSLAHVVAGAADWSDWDVYVDGPPTLITTLSGAFERLYSPTRG